jgi:hypothetical protein
MTRLALTSVIVGAVVIAARLPGVLAPAKYRDFAVKFPRNVFWGRILMGITALIVWPIMYEAASDEWAWARPLIVVGVPVAYFLVFQFTPHYLALRATGALMLLASKQMLVAADASESGLRLIVTVFAYLWVVAAIWMTAAPHHFRDLIGFVTANDRRCKLACSAGVAVGAGLMALGLFVY